MRFFLPVLFAILAASPAMAQDAKPVVIELFTSQSCSSCPPADAMLEKLAADTNVIAIGCHVTYWDHLSWRDTLSLPACTERQRNYAAILSQGVFTPQAIINGTKSAVGSNEGNIRAAISNAGVIERISLNWSAEGAVISIPALSGKTDSIITAFAIGADITQNIGSGENGGQVIHYTRPVMSIIEGGEWDGSAKSLNMAVPAGTGRVAVVAQEKDTGRIIAAGQLVR